VVVGLYPAHVVGEVIDNLGIFHDTTSITIAIVPRLAGQYVRNQAHEYNLSFNTSNVLEIPSTFLTASHSASSPNMDFTIPPALQTYLTNLDAFIANKITPLQNRDDNNRFFDHRREHSRTDWDNQGLPRPEWEALLHTASRLADEAGFWRFSLPRSYGGSNDSSAKGSNLWMAVIREHLAVKGLGLANDLQNEHSVVGNFPDVVMVLHFGTGRQKEELIQGRLKGKVRICFGLTEPEHGSDATFMDSVAVRERDGWRIRGRKMWQTGAHRATHFFVFARTEGKGGDAGGITCFVVPAETEGVKVESYEW